ncbi:MAG: glycosyl transferase, family 2 [Solirubrobacterales bacterium]|nr:glycosyl transferase, family 2 [Solirubrobacterales bacterium]
MLGKFLFDGDKKLYLRGVTYGTFRPGEDDSGYPDPARVDADFQEMALNGVNAVRTYSVPPGYLLEAAARHGLWVLIGLPWEQHVAFLEERALADSIEQRVREGVRACAGHPAVLGYAVGNEIPAPIVRWHGKRRVERFLRMLYEAAKDEDPDALITYVNFPTTEYLQLPFLDFHCFNVYLETDRQLESYLARLQNIAGDRPLVMAEIGLDSRRHGEERQAESVEGQVRVSFATGCAGAFVFAWTDEWHRGGYEVEDWDFGLTDRRRRPKAALAAVRRAFREVPFGPLAEWPKVSVVVCAHNGAGTLRWCLDGLRNLDYPDYEVIVVDDGSADSTAEIARECGFPAISTPSLGLSSARNTGLEAASGEIVAYIDCDARPDRDWLRYLAAAFRASDHAGVGGPNVPPPDGWVADCVANAPGGPVHVLLSDREAEHIPGCNMAFRRQRLIDVGGFDPRFRAAGDDVDVCWRLQERGETLGFSAGAVVGHRARDSVRAYWRQQIGYGRAEALLERKWPAKYNAGGHHSWAGRLYGNGVADGLLPRRWRVYYGRWGSNLFQAMYKTGPPTLGSLALIPEWYLVIALLAALSALGALWTPLLAALPLATAATGLLVAQAFAGGRRANQGMPRRRRRGLRSFLLTTSLHMLQPLARLCGRLRSGLTPWRWRGPGSHSFPRPRSWTLWSESWRSLEGWVGSLEHALRQGGTAVVRGGDFDRWDLELRGGLLGRTRILTAVEEHGHGRQLVRFGFRPRPTWGALLLVAFFGLAAIPAALAGAFAAAAVLGLILALVLGVTARDCARAVGSAKCAADGLADEVLRGDQAVRELAAAAAEGEISTSRREGLPKVGRA